MVVYDEGDGRRTLFVFFFGETDAAMLARVLKWYSANG
jgi:hypothetical protein